MNLKTLLKYFLPIGLAIVILYFLFREIDLSEMLASLGKVNYWWVILSMVISLLSHLARAYRWQLLFKPLGYQIAIGRLAMILMCLYLVNLVLPRAGEVYRCGLLKRTDGVPVSTSLGTVLAERIFDALSLLLILLVDFTVEYKRLNTYFSDHVASSWSNLGSIATILGLLFAVGIVGLLVLFILFRIYREKVRSHKLYIKFLDLLHDFKKGLLSIRHIDNKLGFFLSTFFIWLTYYLMSYVMIYSIPETQGLSILAGLTILAMAGLAMVAPVQGGIGTYHALVGGVLVLYGIESQTGLFFATLLHTSQIVTVVIIGGVSLIAVQLFVNKKGAVNNDKK